MRRTTPSIFAALTLTTALTALTGCSGGVSTEGATGNKDVLTLSAPADMPWLDLSKQSSNYQGWAKEAVYDTLVRCNVKGQWEPDVAEDLTVNSDNTVFTAKIRKGMKFSDGTPVNAATVKASLEYAAKNGGGVSRLKGIKVTTPDAMTAVITMPQPYPTLPTYLCGGQGIIASAKYIKAGKINSTNPVGSGPYTYDKAASTSGSQYVFNKNNDYWDADNFPYKKLVIKVITSETAIVNALKTGQIDGAPISDTTYNEAKSSGLGIQTLTGVTTRLLLTDHDGKKVPALGNVNVRRAMNMVFDKKALANDLYQGRAEATSQIFRKGTSAYIDGLEDPYPYNVKKAKELMAKAGYGNGFSLEIPYIAGTAGMDSLLPVVKQQLGLLNIKVKQVTLSGPNAILNLLSGKYPVVLWPLGNTGDSRADIEGTVLDTGLWNLEHQPDATVTKLWKTILTADSKGSVTAQQQVNRYIIDQAWFVPMVYPDWYYAYDRKKVDLQAATDMEGLNPLLWNFK
ncbi:ABC transporter substrate-binding protein [Streptomyces sp. NPDC048282]|uniref:ABC transporter substrate-binding protein n=1 Tax=Streptomyces sp. NPDC048282 TaxID=3365528 RepID=UPI00371DC374